MKRSVASLSWSAPRALLLLTLSIVVAAGCSRSGGQEGDYADEFSSEYGITKSELKALRRANKNPKDLKRAVVEKRNEKLKEMGVAVQTTKSPKTAKRPR